MALVVDTHTHVIAPDPARYPLKPAGLSKDLDGGRGPADWFEKHAVSADGLVGEAQSCGVDRLVFVQAMGAYEFDNDYCADAAAAHATHATSVCIVDPEASDAPDRLRHWVQDRGMRGVRLFAIGKNDTEWFTSATVLQLVSAAEGLGIPMVVTILPNQIPGLVALLERFPKLPMALDHCGFPNLTGGAPYPDASSLFALARYPNLHLKVSGLVLGQIADRGERPADFVRTLAAEFGAPRLLWGSDYPQTHSRTYPALVELCRNAAEDLGSEDRSWYLGRTATTLWPELGENASAP